MLRDWLLGLAAIVGIVSLVGVAVLTARFNQTGADAADSTERNTTLEATLTPTPAPLGVPGQSGPYSPKDPEGKVRHLITHFEPNGQGGRFGETTFEYSGKAYEILGLTYTDGTDAILLVTKPPLDPGRAALYLHFTKPHAQGEFVLAIGAAKRGVEEGTLIWWYSKRPWDIGEDVVLRILSDKPVPDSNHCPDQWEVCI